LARSTTVPRCAVPVP